MNYNMNYNIFIVIFYLARANRVGSQKGHVL